MIKVTRITRKEKIVSDSIYLGQSSKSTDKARTAMVIDIKTGLTPIIKRLLENRSRENNTRERFRARKAYCHPLPKNTFNNATIITGVV